MVWPVSMRMAGNFDIDHKWAVIIHLSTEQPFSDYSNMHAATCQGVCSLRSHTPCIILLFRMVRLDVLWICLLFGLLSETFRASEGLSVDVFVILDFRQVTLFCHAVETTTMVLLDSTLNTSHGVAYPQQQVIFTCVTRGTAILEWRSEEHIGTGSDSLQFLSFERPGHRKSKPHNPSTVATLVSVSTDSGVTEITSNLLIIASSQFPVSSVMCGDSGHTTSNITTFHTSGQAN